MKPNRKLISEKRFGGLLNTIEKFHDTGNICFTSCKIDDHTNFNCVIMPPLEAIQTALIVLKCYGVIPENTTMEDLEKRGE